MAENVIVAPIICVPPRKVKGRAMNIIDSTASDATQVVVTSDVGVESGLGAANSSF